ncbi:MAG TPA: septum formation initiator family protein [bacterium]|nr:septum formation initiator family protein [bacterium]
MKRENRQKKQDNQVKTSYQKWMKSGWLTFFGVLVLLLIVWPLWSNLSQEKALERDIKSAEEEIKQYESENQELQELINYLDSDQAVETTAKMNLGMKKEGEKVIVIQEAPTAVAAGEENADTDSRHNLARWYKYFFR